MKSRSQFEEFLKLFIRQTDTDFLEFLGKVPEQANALFIPTAAIDADAIEVLPKCMNSGFFDWFRVAALKTLCLKYDGVSDNERT